MGLCNQKEVHPWNIPLTFNIVQHIQMSYCNLVFVYPTDKTTPFWNTALCLVGKHVIISIKGKVIFIQQDVSNHSLKTIGNLFGANHIIIPCFPVTFFVLRC